MTESPSRVFVDNINDEGRKLYHLLKERGDEFGALVVLQLVGELACLRTERNALARELADLRDENTALRAGIDQVIEDNGEQFTGRVLAEVRHEDAEQALDRVKELLDEALLSRYQVVDVFDLRRAVAGPVEPRQC